MHSGESIAMKQNSAVSLYVGIASLVLEGRIISTDEDEEDAFKKKFESNPSHFSAETVAAQSSGSGSSSGRHGVIHRISEKLMRLRQFPGSNKDVIESIAIPTQSRDDCEYERQPRLIHVASAREFQRSPRLTNVPTSSSSNCSSAASVLHDIDVDWNDISILFNGLDSLNNLPGSPIKISPNHPFKSSIPMLPSPMHSEPSLKMFRGKEKVGGKAASKPKQGPHCEKFLKKIGIVKSDSMESDHMCNHVNSFCRRWQLHLKMLLQILSKGEDACIEVYLGPENNAILLEQWTFKLTENPSPSTMTIAALCSAIRSQLYFSQVSSWVDLLRKAFVDGDMSAKEQMPSLFSPEIMQNPRLKKNLETMQVDLDILFRIKSYDGAACFNDKPNIHNFPDTIVSDRMALRVCLKSLPRLEKIPTLNTEKANSNGFTCDNRIKASIPLSSPVPGTSCHLLNDRMLYPSCHEKGKHRCKDEDEEEYEVLEEKKQSKTSANPSPSLSHRERQLLKYKKRLMKRDKQKKKVQDGDQASVSSLNTSGSEEFEKFPDAPAINDTFAPLYGESTANNHLKTLSIATQTDDPKSNICNNCGDHLQCWNCDKTQSGSNIGSVMGTMVGNKADLLLQAIQRTANAHPRDKTKNNILNNAKAHRGEPSSSAATDAIDEANCDTLNDNNDLLVNNNNNNNENSDASGDKETNDCRLCKRQKTRHNYTPSMSISSNSPSGSYRRTMSECLVSDTTTTTIGDDDEVDHIKVEPLTLQHNCDDAEFNYASTATEEHFSYGELKAYRRAFSDDIINQLPTESSRYEDEEGSTVVCNHCVKSTSTFKLTPNVTLQQARPISSMSPHKKLVIVNGKQQLQKIPKINLSQLFDRIKDDSGIVQDTSPTSDNVFAFNSSPASSYPPTMMQLSPRFPRGTTSLLKRRSRHISDRSSISEYSNISDDDEEALKAVVKTSAPAKISSLYKKFVSKTHATFNKLPLLGTIEESLLRDRFQPQAIVNGFKLLLGASGSFCPTQLTIPAQTFFYEFKGLKHMSTPYVCEFRLSRKGYSIPRQGTVQATLLNPQGTVVRMFFVPYDFRDMPVMSQTFIRQRVLAIDEHVSQKSAEQMSTAEQMKHLRYAVHLRFQTGRSGRLCLHTDIKLLISRRTEFDTAQAHAKNSLESPNDLKSVMIAPENPKFSSRVDKV